MGIFDYLWLSQTKESDRSANCFNHQNQKDTLTDQRALPKITLPFIFDSPSHIKNSSASASAINDGSSSLEFKASDQIAFRNLINNNPRLRKINKNHSLHNYIKKQQANTASITADPWLAKPKRRTVPRVASDVMTSCRARRMSEGRLKREYVDSPLYRVRGMAVPQLVWVNVKTGGSSPLSANISNRLSSEMSLATGTRKYIAVSFAAAKR